jgi:hypothetical protein
MNWWLRQKYRVLLLTMVLLLVAQPLTHDLYGGRLLFNLLWTMVFLAAFQLIFTQRSLRLMALVLGLPSLVGLWTRIALPGLPDYTLVTGFHLVSAAFLGFTTVTIIRAIFREEQVTPDSIYGAFCGYLLNGLAFGHLYCFLATMSPESFHGWAGFRVEIQDEARRHFLLTYFSFITLTTTGYGDIQPASDLARGLAVAEAILGQFYIAVLIAELIGKKVSQTLADQQSNPKR